MIWSPKREIRSSPLASLGSEKVRSELLRGWSCREEATSLGLPPQGV